MRPFMRIVLASLAGLMCLAAAAQAQTIDYRERARDLVFLSQVFGELHHIRRMCEPRAEAEIWRERMRRMLELEEPAPTLREDMIRAFNDGFRRAERAFAYCDRDARDHAAGLAAQADATAARLAAPLYEALARTEGAPTVWRGDEDGR
ncbi:MAG: hypothetical protein Kow00133_13920 [Amphiplicatus sp.]